LSAIYEVAVDPNAENNSHSFALSFIGYNKTVLEVGCSTGYFTKVMVERGCEVVGIELDPDAAEVAEKWAERVVIGNIDEGQIWDEIKDESFDVIVMGDVLEHLRDPLGSLRQAVRKLKPSGFVVTSLPNIAHGDVRMTLMQGRFDYNDTGLLDRTHVHFFTLETARKLLTEAGLIPVDTKRVVMPLFMSELGIKRENVSHAVIDELLADPEVESYQFVMKSVRDNGTRTLSELGSRVNALSDQVHRLNVQAALLRQARLENVELVGHLQEHQKYIEALQGHVSGLEHNIEVLTEALTTSNLDLTASHARYEAVVASRSYRIAARLGRAHASVTRKKPS
jgi:O-antigen biosynthesis protein